MRGFLSLLLLQIPLAVWGASVQHIEVYPKPAKANRVVYFRITVVDAGGDVRIPGDFGISVSGRPTSVEFETRISQDAGVSDFYFQGVAPRDFDSRQVRVRWAGTDYPAGPDDPYMVCDAPFRVKSAAAPIPISVTFHEADNDDVQLQFIEVFNDASGALVTSYPIWEWISAPYRYYLFNDLTAWNFDGSAGDTAWVKVVLHCDDHDWPWIPEQYTFTQHLKVRIGRDLPALAGWYYGDVHDHSQYTNNMYEYGGPQEMFAAAAEALGLSFVAISDHSSDFDAAGNLWAQMASGCQAYSTNAVRLIPSEEICVDDNEINNPIDNRIHFLNNAGVFIRGPEAPITGSMDVSDAFTRLSEAVTQMEAAGGFGYAAHPFQAFDPFVALFGMAMMTWSDENYSIARASSALAGLEFWNERNRYRKNVDYWYELNPFPWENNPNWALENTWMAEGLARWDEFLSQGLNQNLVVPSLLPQKLFVAAGSDCHGDFNYRTYNVDPIFYNVYATDNAFGILRTAVYVPGYGPGQIPSAQELMTAYRLGSSIITDGPFLEIGVDANGDGDLDDAEDIRIGNDKVLYADQLAPADLLVRWESSEDWGTVQTISVLRGTSTTGSNPTAVWTANPNSYSGQQSIPISNLVPVPSNGWVYLRAQAIGSPLPDDARRAFTNPVWLRIDATPTASISLDPSDPPVIVPAHGGSFQYLIQVANHLATPVNCQVWVEAILPNGSAYSALNVPIALPANYSTSRLRTQAVPASAPAGDYAYLAHIGLYPTPWVTDGFMFSKIGSAGQNFVGFGESNLQVHQNFIGLGASDLRLRPEELALSVKPNPFNPSTTISYQLAALGHVRIGVFDTAGRLVASLVDGRQAAGEHEITFDGSKLASGLYVYRLETGDFSASGKLLLMK